MSAQDRLRRCRRRSSSIAMAKLSDLGPPIKGTRRGGLPASEADHFYFCPTCGQAVDRRDLRQVIWHEQPGHEPLEMDGRWTHRERALYVTSRNA